MSVKWAAPGQRASVGLRVDFIWCRFESRASTDNLFWSQPVMLISARLIHAYRWMQKTPWRNFLCGPLLFFGLHSGVVAATQFGDGNSMGGIGIDPVRNVGGSGFVATNCVILGFKKSPHKGHDSQTLTNNCSFTIYVMHCHTPTDLPGTSSSACGNEGKYFQQAYWLRPGQVKDNFFNLPPGTEIHFGVCSGGKNPDLPSGGQKDELPGRFHCK